MLPDREAASRRHTPEALLARYQRVRRTTERLCSTLVPEDFVVQSMPDVSPTKWHLAHVSWFFERFVLEHFDSQYRRYNESFHYLFNSYYFSVGQMHARPKRGLLSRPTVAEIRQYRQHVDEQMQELITRRAGDPELAQRTTLGLHHEQQHQELLLTDIKHVFSCNPLLPAVNSGLTIPPEASPADLTWQDGAAGIQEIGTNGDDAFCFDNETPRHRVLLQEHSLANRLVTNAEYRDFIRDGAYSNPALWLSDGWSVISQRNWQRPLYWSDDLELEFTLAGQRTLELHAPVTHISYYEADAYARWAGARLPLEAEWETAAAQREIDGNFLDNNVWHPVAGNGQFFGDVWECTASPYTAYPGFKPLAGSLGEYNGKFMCNQMTVRGGSCVTSREHMRASYRSFFYPDARWQFLGLRLAKNAVPA